MVASRQGVTELFPSYAKDLDQSSFGMREHKKSPIQYKVLLYATHKTSKA